MSETKINLKKAKVSVAKEPQQILRSSTRDPSESKMYKLQDYTGSSSCVMSYRESPFLPYISREKKSSRDIGFSLSKITGQYINQVVSDLNSLISPSMKESSEVGVQDLRLAILEISNVFHHMSGSAPIESVSYHKERGIASDKIYDDLEGCGSEFYSYFPSTRLVRSKSLSRHVKHTVRLLPADRKRRSRCSTRTHSMSKLSMSRSSTCPPYRLKRVRKQ